MTVNSVGEGKLIESDETFIGHTGSHDPDSRIFVSGVGWVRKSGDEKMKVMRLVERRLRPLESHRSSDFSEGV